MSVITVRGIILIVGICCCIVLALRAALAFNKPLEEQSPTASEPSVVFQDSLSLSENIDQVVKKLSPPSVKGPGLALVVKQAGKVLYNRCSGLANLENKQVINNTSSFYLASVSKQFTAMAIMLLEQENKIRPSDPIIQYFPSLPEHWKSITVHHLLTHQSGIPDYLNEMSLPVKQITNEAVVNALAKKDKLHFQPGTQFRYSNTGYVLLALLVEKVSGRPFEVFLREAIFKPLGMSNTFVYTKANTAAGLVRGYRADRQPTDYNLLTKGDGGMYSSLHDLLLWSDGFIQQTLIPEKQHTTLVRNPATVNADLSYGYGWLLSRWRDITLFSHGGSLVGFHNSILIVPDQKFTIIILSNGSYDNTIEQLNDQILQYCARAWK